MRTIIAFITILSTQACASSNFGLSEADPPNDVVSTSTEVGVTVVADASTSNEVGMPDTIVVSADTSYSDTDVFDAIDAVDAKPKFTSTPGYVACASESDKCEKSKGERCCIEDSGSLLCHNSSMAVCEYTKQYACDETADCGGSACCLWPSGGSQCGCVDGAVQLCMTSEECPSGVCEPYTAWPGHGRCKV